MQNRHFVYYYKFSFWYGKAREPKKGGEKKYARTRTLNRFYNTIGLHVPFTNCIIFHSARARAESLKLAARKYAAIKIFNI